MKLKNIAVGISLTLAALQFGCADLNVDVVSGRDCEAAQKTGLSFVYTCPEPRYP
jgi:hypothetical protein